MKNLPDGYSLGFFFNITRGDKLDIWAEKYELKRKKWFIFKESDKSYKNRIVEAAVKEKGL